MMELQRLFDSYIGAGIRALTHDCFCASIVDGVECIHIPDCNVCGGTRKQVPKIHDIAVMGFVLTAWTMIIQTHRNLGHYETVNEMLDISEHYVVSMMEIEGRELGPEQFNDAVRKGAKFLEEALQDGDLVPPRQSTVTVSGSALSSDELRELGIEP